MSVQKRKQIEWCSVHFSDWFVDPDTPSKFQTQCSWSVACGSRPGQAECRHRTAVVEWTQPSDRRMTRDDEGNWM